MFMQIIIYSETHFDEMQEYRPYPKKVNKIKSLSKLFEIIDSNNFLIKKYLEPYI